MKKIFSTVILIAGALMFAGCAGEEKDLFEKSAAERLNETGKIYSSRLQSSEAGWVMEYYPTNTDETYKGRGYLIMADFDKDESVTLAMKNIMSDDEYMEERSLWEIIADNGPVLTFNTYNEVLHCFSNPEYYESGKGFEGDYEFVMIDVPEDGQFIMLKGKKRGTYVRLTRLPDGTDFQEYLNDVNAFTKKIFPENAVNEDVLTIGDKKFAINSGSTGIMGMYPYGGDAITETTQHPFLITKRDGMYFLRFRSTIEANDVEEQEFVYEADEDKFVGVEKIGNVIEGEDPATFLLNNLESGSWTALKTAEMSDKMKTYFDALDAEFSEMKDSRKRSYTFSGMTLTREKDGSNYRWNVGYKVPGSSRVTYAQYNYSMQHEGENVAFTYLAPVDESATNIQAKLPSVQNVTTLFGRKFVVRAAQTRFNLRQIRLTAADDADLWVVLTIG